MLVHRSNGAPRRDDAREIRPGRPYQMNTDDQTAPDIEIPGAAGEAGSTRRRQLRDAAWSILIAVVVLVFVWTQRADLLKALHELRFAGRWWLAALLATALAMHAFMTQALSSILSRLGRRIPFPPAFMTHIEREMIAAVMPFGGVASFIALVTRFGPYGVTRNDAVLAVMLYSVVGHLSFLLVAIPVMLWLALQHSATGIIWIGGAVVVASVTGIGLLVSALVNGKRLPRVIDTRLPEVVQAFRAQAQGISLPARSLAIPIVFSLGGDLCGAASMWLALRALHVDITVPAAAAAYVVGTLLMLAAPIFQGLGVVEVSVTLVLQQLGVPLPQALGATILYRLVEVWLPVVLGVGVHAGSQRSLRGFPGALPALWTGLTGLLAIASVLPERVRHSIRDTPRVEGLAMFHPDHVGRTISLVAGFLMLVLAVRLLRRQHSAWIVAVILTGVVMAVSLTRDIDGLNAILAGTNLVLLLLYRKRFRVRSDIPSLRRGLVIFLLSVSVTYAYGVLSLWLADRHQFTREFSIASSLRAAWDVYLGLDSGGLTPRTGRGEWILDSMHALAALSLAISALAILQPIIWRGRVRQSDTDRARRLVTAFGDSSLDQFKYWPDKYQFFATGDMGVVSYGVSGRVALALGDPSARDDAALARTLDEFLDLCEVNGWEPAFHQVPPHHLPAYRQRGFTLVMIGQDAIIHLASFTMSGHSMKNLRSLRNRAQRDGIEVQVIDPPLPDDLVRELREISDDWLTLEGRRERTFTLGQFDPAYIRSCPVLVLRSPSGRGEAFINLIHDGAPGEITFDLMRHRVDALNGAMDLLILALVDLARERGYTAVSLGMVPFVTAKPSEQTALVEQAIARLAKPMGRFFASKSLFAYKDKFHPDWEPRYLVVRSLAQLPRVTLALTRLAELDEKRRARRHPHAASDLDHAS